MGGINPNRPDGYLVNRAVQEHCQRVFLAISEFFRAHALLEQLVMDEADEVALDQAAVMEIEQAFKGVVSSLAAARENITDDLLAKADSEGTWQGAYLRQQREGLEQTLASVRDVSEAAIVGAFNAAVDEGLQESMWHSGSNARVRIGSVNSVRNFAALLEHHVTVVEETND